MSRDTFNPDKDIPSFAGKVVFVTGGTTGLGKESVKALSKHGPAHVYFSGRNASRAKELISEIKSIDPNVGVTFIELDMTSLQSIRKGMKDFAHDRLDVLMCNAGVMARPPELSKDGYEMQFAVNHLGHAAIIQHVLPTLIRTSEEAGSDVRIVMLTSLGWRGHPRGGILFDKLTTPMDMVFGGWIRYGQSKLANIVYAAELARRYSKITSVSVHPGVVATELVGEQSLARKALIYATNPGQVMEPEDGAKSQLWVAAGGQKTDIVNGAYYMPVGVMSNSTLDSTAKSEKLRKQLWDWTEKVLEESG